jgi:hypothetical protein
MDEGTTLSGLESEDDAKPSHGLLAVLSSLWGRGYLTHRLRIRFPEDEGVRRPKQPDHARGVRPRDLQVGDLVLRLRQDARGRHKLTPPWEGSFIIAKILKPGTYKLANSQGEVYSNTWNIRQLRRFYP